MNLSMDIIQEELSTQFQIGHNVTGCLSEMNLCGVEFLAGVPPKPDLLYLVEGRRLPVRWKYQDHASLVIVGNVSDGYFENKNVSYITIDDNRFPTVFNAVLEIFRRYDTLDQKLQDDIIHSNSPDVVCNQISDVLGCPMIVTDNAFRVRYFSDGAENLLNWETDSFSGLPLVPTEFMNDINLVYTESPENSANGAVLLQDDRLPYNIITTSNRACSFHLIVFEGSTKLTRGTLETAGYLHQYILYAFQNTGHREVNQGLSSLISSMLDGKRFTSTDLENKLNNVNWKIDDTCCCVVVYTPKGSRSSKYLDTICLKLENLLKVCVAFPYQGQAVAIVNLNKVDFSIRDIPNRIGLLLREGLLKAAISFTYWNFETTPIYYQQACCAYDIGSLYTPSHWCYLFEDHALSYFMHYGSSRLPPRHLCHPALVHLYRYDRENGTDLLKTLEAYVGNNCNAVTAANKLFIHRNTFYQRMSKIQELLNLDLEDQDVRLYLQLSTYLISMYHYELENEFRFPYE